MSETEQRAAVLEAARSWIGTPFRNCADVKGAGVDCGMLLVRVFCDLKLLPPFDPRPYPADWYLHRNDEIYLGFIERHCREITAAELRQGDIALYKIGRCYAHGGIVARADPLRIVHAQAPHCVLEEDVRYIARLFGKPQRLFSLWR